MAYVDVYYIWRYVEGGRYRMKWHFWALGMRESVGVFDINIYIRPSCERGRGRMAIKRGSSHR